MLTHGLVMHSDTVVVATFLFAATARQAMSRSVITPTGRIVSRPSTTGISPQSKSHIARATSCSVASGVQHATVVVMMSLTFIFDLRGRPLEDAGGPTTRRPRATHVPGKGKVPIV